MIVIDLEGQIGSIVFNVIGHLVLQQHAVAQLFGHEERRRVIGFWFNVGHVCRRRVSVSGERGDGVRKRK